MDSMRFYGKSLIFLILQEKTGKLKNITISRDINIIALISTPLIMFISIHFLTIKRVMEPRHSAFGKWFSKMTSNLTTEAFVQEGLDEAFSLYMGSEVSYISDTWVGLRLRQAIWLV